MTNTSPVPCDPAPAPENKPVGLRLPPVSTKPREKMSARELMDSQRDQQSAINLECEIRRLARAAGLDAAKVDAVAEAGRKAFRIVAGEPVPVAEDRMTVLLAPDGENVLSVTEWVERQARLHGLQPRATDGTWLPKDQVGADTLPRRNPFLKKTWNLTEQMHLQRRDPHLARRMQAEAWAVGDLPNSHRPR